MCRVFDLPELSGCESSQQCPAEWREINSRCYFLSSESKTWEESRSYCQSRGADLVVINSEQEQVQFSKSVFVSVCVCHSWDLLYVERKVLVMLSVISILTEGLIPSEWRSCSLVLDWSELHGWGFQMGRWICTDQIVRPLE